MRKEAMIRRYTFSRPLTDSEASLLLLVVGWRAGAQALLVFRWLGASRHPDDVAQFQAELRNSGERIAVTCTSIGGTHGRD